MRTIFCSERTKQKQHVSPYWNEQKNGETHRPSASEKQIRHIKLHRVLRIAMTATNLTI